MAWDDPQWVSDEDGLRCYYAYREKGGPTQLECYRRLLSEPSATDQYAASLSLTSCVRRFADLIAVGRSGLRVRHGWLHGRADAPGA
jgi:hypothetical protein